MTLGGVGQQLGNVASDFDPRTYYGNAKLSDLAAAMGTFELDAATAAPSHPLEAGN